MQEQLLTKRADVMARFFLDPYLYDLLDAEIDAIAQPRPDKREVSHCGPWPNPRL
ncbi:MAG: hypothetical protein WDM91_07755 [Rhizomicrobium sp.]